MTEEWLDRKSKSIVKQDLDSISNSIVKQATLECIAGDDAYLLYYYRCRICDTIIIENHRENYKFLSYECPVCNSNQKNFPFEYVNSDKLDEYRVDIPILTEEGIGRAEITLRQRIEAGFLGDE